MPSFLTFEVCHHVLVTKIVPLHFTLWRFHRSLILNIINYNKIAQRLCYRSYLTFLSRTKVSTCRSNAFIYLVLHVYLTLPHHIILEQLRSHWLPVSSRVHTVIKSHGIWKIHFPDQEKSCIRKNGRSHGISSFFVQIFHAVFEKTGNIHLVIN